MHSTAVTTPRTRVKICGITCVEDALVAAEAGADAIGLVFYAKSPRALVADAARRIVASLPPFVASVALFVNPERAEVEAVISATGVDLLQFHGDESPAFCSSFSRPYIKALRMKADADLTAFAGSHAQARGVLVDAWEQDRFGGTGKTFDWQRIRPEAGSSRIILAGGLPPDNVAQAITAVRPWAVDVSSGVELAPGRKSAERIQSFIKEVRRV